MNNHYGPTETTIDAIVNTDVLNVNKNIIGKPIKGTDVFILGMNDIFSPLSHIGEICIGGSGVSQGYVKNKQKNTGCFCSKPI